MPNTSATGGYLQPTTAALEGLALRRFLQSVIVGVTGLAGNLVRPRWQANPPPIPAIETPWCAFGIARSKGDDNAYTEEKADGMGGTLIRHQDLDVLCSFYSEQCLDYTERLRDGLQMAQNREQLFLAGMGLIGFSDSTHVPELVNNRYLERADITMSIRREIRREYKVLNFVAASGTIQANREITTLSRSWSA